MLMYNDYELQCHGSADFLHWFEKATTTTTFESATIDSNANRDTMQLPVSVQTLIKESDDLYMKLYMQRIR